MAELDTHRKNVYHIASKIITTREFESDDFRVRLPREAAALESITYGQGEEFLVKADGNYSLLQTYLAQAAAARSFFKRMADMKETTLMGDPELQANAKNDKERARNVSLDKDYIELQQYLRTAETVTVYLEKLSAAADATLQVVKKIRDAALSRKERDENWAHAR
jgi:hypothetical protein